MKRLILLPSVILALVSLATVLVSQEVIVVTHKVAAAPVTPQLIQGKTCNRATTNATITCAFTSNVTSNNLLVAITRWQDTSGPWTVAVSNSVGAACSGGTWSPIYAEVISDINMYGVQGFYCIAGGTGAQTVQAVTTGDNQYADLTIAEYSGIATSSPLDTAIAAANTTSGTKTTPCASGATATLSTTGELVIGYCSMWDSTQAWATNGNFVYESAVSDSTIGFFDYVSGTTTAPSFSYAITADFWASLTAAFKHQ